MKNRKNAPADLPATDDEIVEAMATDDDVEVPSEEDLEQDVTEEYTYVDGVATYIRSIGQYRVLSKEETNELFVALQNGDTSARNKIAEHNLRLAFHIAKQYRNQDAIPLIDLVQEANLGLCRAIDKFDLSMGYAFTTYATWWITAAVRRSLQDQGTIHVPIYMVEWMNKVRRAQRQFESLNEDYSTADLARVTGLKESQVKRALTTIKKSEVLSLDYVNDAGEDKDSTLGDTIADDTDVEEDTMSNEREQLYLELMSKILTKREQDVFCRHFGYGPYRSQETFEEIAVHYNVSKQRIAQIYGKALEKLQSPASKKQFKEIAH